MQRQIHTIQTQATHPDTRTPIHTPHKHTPHTPCKRIHTYIHTYIHTCTDRQTDRQTYQHVCTCIHTCIHTYIPPTYLPTYLPTQLSEITLVIVKLRATLLMISSLHESGPRTTHHKHANLPRICVKNNKGGYSRTMMCVLS